MKHGLRSRALVLPSEDMQQFRELRHDLFAEHRPSTRHEARCVETMVACEWRMARCRRHEALCRERVEALLYEGGGRDEGALHDWMHKGRECCADEQRFDWMLSRAVRRLHLLQAQRAQRLLPKGELATDWKDFEREEETCAQDGEPASDLAPEGLVASIPVKTVPRVLSALQRAGTHRVLSDSPRTGSGKSGKRTGQTELDRLLQKLRPSVGHG